MKPRALYSGLSLREGISAALIVVLVLAFGVTRCQRDRARADARGNALRADSTAAATDSTRAMVARAKKILGDSITGVERRAWQAKIQRDALDKALKRVTEAKTNVVVALKDLRVSDTTSRVLDSGDTRTATFTVDSVPYHAVATVALPPAPKPGRFTLDIRSDPAKIGVRIQCGKPSGAGIRPATVGVTTPPWLSAQIDSPQFSPDVCNPEKEKGWKLPWWTAPVGLLVGTLLGAAVSQ